MTWTYMTILLAVGMLLAETVRSQTLKRDPDNPNNGAGLYTAVTLLWPGIFLYLLGYRILKGRLPPEK